MWRKGDEVISWNGDWTELLYDGKDYEDMEKTRLTVASKDADTILTWLNELWEMKK